MIEYAQGIGNDMMGIAGFTALAIATGVYAYTSYATYILVPLRIRRSFVSAFSLLAVAAITWAMTFLLDPRIISTLIFLSDVVLLVGTACMLNVLIDLSRPRYIVPVTVIGAGLLTLRAFTHTSAAYVEDGLLYFNLPQLLTVLIGLIFLLVWLPASVKVVYQALRSSNTIGLRGVMSFSLMATVLMTSFFLSAQRPIMIIITFVSIIVLFCGLSGLNFVLDRLQKQPTKRSVRHGIKR